MAKLIQRLIELRREKVLAERLLQVFLSRMSTLCWRLSLHCVRLSVFCMRCGIVRLSYFLAKLHYQLAMPHYRMAKPGWDPSKKDEEVGIYRYQSVASGIDYQAREISVYPERELTLNPVQRVGFKYKQSDLHNQNHHITLPSVSLYTFSHVEVIGSSEMIFTREGSLLYDELALGDMNRYGVKAHSIVPSDGLAPYFPAASKEYVICRYHRPLHSTEVLRAISLLKDYSQNYFHWLLECLPRAIMALRHPDWDDAPLLIDVDMPSQHIESLRLLSPERKHIPVPKGMRLPVQMLYFPSVLSFTHDYYGTSPRTEDFLIAPEAVALLRESFLQNATSSAIKQNQQFIYVARSSVYRSILNDHEVINALVELGFSIVYPENLSFAEQIALFSNAKIIVGPTGAGMTNMVFAGADCKIVVLAAVTHGANFYIFSQIAQYLNQQIVYFGGEPIDPSDLHSHYHINVHALQMMIEKLCDSRKIVTGMSASNR